MAAAALTGNKELFLDIHELGAGNVTAAAVADAHQKDLAVQEKYGVNFINYWVDEKAEWYFACLKQRMPESVTDTHKEAHGLIPAEIWNVKQGKGETMNAQVKQIATFGGGSVITCTLDRYELVMNRYTLLTTSFQHKISRILKSERRPMAVFPF